MRRVAAVLLLCLGCESETAPFAEPLPRDAGPPTERVEGGSFPCWVPDAGGLCIAPGPYEWIGKGVGFYAAVPESVIFWSVSSFRIEGPESAGLHLTPPVYSTLQVGRYRAARVPGPSELGFSVSARGAGCNRAWGTVDIHEVELDALRQPRLIDLTFVQYCENYASPAHGRFRYDVRVSALERRDAGVDAGLDAGGGPI